MIIKVECALITPLEGLNLYVIQSVARATLGDVARGVMPFLALMLVSPWRCSISGLIWPSYPLQMVTR